MESKKCEKCGKIIEGFSQKHVDTLMAQHMIKHQNEENAVKAQKLHRRRKENESKR